MRRSPRSRRRARRSERIAGYAFVLPVVLLMAIFIYWPLGYSVYLSTLDWNFVSPDKDFVGLANFAGLFDDAAFPRTLVQTGKYLLVLVPALVLLPLALAVMLASISRSRAQTAYRTVLFTPTVVSFSAAAVIWLWIFNPVGGVLNQFIGLFGLQDSRWLSEPDLAFWCVIGVCVWKLLGFNLLLYLIALESVPKPYLEAAALDGARGWGMFRHIRLPLITPTLFFVIVSTTIFVTEDVFDAISILTQGGPYGRTTNVLYYLYERGFQFFEVGEASAVALVIFVAIVGVTFLQFRFARRYVHYA